MLSRKSQSDPITEEQSVLVDQRAILKIRLGLVAQMQHEADTTLKVGILAAVQDHLWRDRVPSSHPTACSLNCWQSNSRFSSSWKSKQAQMVQLPIHLWKV